MRSLACRVSHSLGTGGRSATMASATQRKKATMPFSPAPFTPTPYTPPDFTLPHLAAAPDVTLVPAPKDFVAPEGYHAMSIYPEYLKIAGQWTLARDSRMDCVAVVEGGNVFVREFRHIRAGDLIACGRTENGEEGILVYTDGFRGLATSEDGAPHPGGHDNFAFRGPLPRDRLLARLRRALRASAPRPRPWLHRMGHGAGLHVQRVLPRGLRENHRRRLCGRGIRRQCSRHPRFGRGLLPHVPRPGHRHPGEPP